MQVFGVTLPTVEQALYRPGITPHLKKISSVALASIGATSTLALFVFSAKIVLPCALTASLVAWLYPVFIGGKAAEPAVLPPKYALLIGYGITEEKVGEFRDLAESCNFTTFEAFLDTFNDSLVKVLKEARLFQALNPILEKGVDQGRISSKVLLKIAPLLSKHGILNAKDFKPNLKVVANDHSEFTCNRTVLQMSSDYFSAMLRSNLKEAEESTISFPLLSGPTLQGLVHFLAANGEPIQLSAEAYIHLLNFAHLARTEALSHWAKAQLFSLAVLCKDKTLLNQFLQNTDIQLNDEFDQTYVNGVISEALTCYLKEAYEFRGEFQYTHDLFAMPVEALGLLNVNDRVGDYLAGNVNCISVGQAFDDDVFDKLKMVLSLLPADQKTQLTALQVPSIDVFYENEVFFGKILELFPQVKKVCLTVWAEPQYNRGRCNYFRSDLVEFFNFFEKKKIPERALVFGEFYDQYRNTDFPTFVIGDWSQDYSTMTGRRAEPITGAIVEVIKAATHVENLTESTQIAFCQGLGENIYDGTFADEFGKLLRSKISNRRIKAVNVKYATRILTVSFDV